MSDYTPNIPPTGFNLDLELYLSDEFRRIANALSSTDKVQFNIWHSEPDKVYEGMLVYADGTNWQPVTGEGRGLYVYRENSWRKIAEA